MAIKSKPKSRSSSRIIPKSKPSKNKLAMHTPVTRGFSELLATTYALYLKTQNFHWNVTGIYFPMLHRFFEEQYQELAEAVDLIAERIRALNHFAPASFQEFIALRVIKDTLGKRNAVQMLQELSLDHELITHLLQKLIQLTQKFHDDASQDMLIERLRTHEKALWMLNSCFESKGSKLK